MSQRLKADLALGACMFMWGATFVVVQNALAYASVFAFLSVRFVLAALVMLAIYWRTVRGLDRAGNCCWLRDRRVSLLWLHLPDRRAEIHDAFEGRVLERLERGVRSRACWRCSGASESIAGLGLARWWRCSGFTLWLCRRRDSEI